MLVSSPGAPDDVAQVVRGRRHVGRVGHVATQGERKRGSVVAAAIASTDPGSGLSTVWAAADATAIRLAAAAAIAKRWR